MIIRYLSLNIELNLINHCLVLHVLLKITLLLVFQNPGPRLIYVPGVCQFVRQYT